MRSFTWEEYRERWEEQLVIREADSKISRAFAKENFDCIIECFGEEWISKQLRQLAKNSTIGLHPLIRLLTSTDLKSYIKLNEIGSDLKFFQDKVSNDKLNKWVNESRTNKGRFESLLLEISMYSRFKRIMPDLEFDKHVTSRYPADLVSNHESIIVEITRSGSGRISNFNKQAQVNLIEPIVHAMKEINIPGTLMLDLTPLWEDQYNYNHLKQDILKEVRSHLRKSHTEFRVGKICSCHMNYGKPEPFYQDRYEHNKNLIQRVFGPGYNFCIGIDDYIDKDRSEYHDRCIYRVVAKLPEEKFDPVRLANSLKKKRSQLGKLRNSINRYNYNSLLVVEVMGFEDIGDRTVLQQLQEKSMPLSNVADYCLFLHKGWLVLENRYGFSGCLNRFRISPRLERIYHSFISQEQNLDLLNSGRVQLYKNYQKNIL